jgi:putative Ca2+/H+ antiporter (TMEM165/GDT1 family)
MLIDMLIPFTAVALAELGDKTQLSVLLLALKTKEHLRLFLGVMLAFFLVDGFAILAGSWITGVIPMNILKLLSGGLFTVFGILILKELQAEKPQELQINRDPMVSGFLLIFASEWGDKTQIASALFATQYEFWQVLLGTMAALSLLTLIAIYAGRTLLTRFDKRAVTKLAGTAFILMGLSLFLL